MTTYRSFGVFGLLILLFGLIAGAITLEWTSTYVLVHLLLGGALLALYLFTHVETLKDSVTGRKAKYGTNTVVYTLLTLALLGMFNYLAVQNPWRYDATAQGVFSLAPQTEQILEGLENDVVARAFVRENEEAAARDLLESYDYASERFTFEIVDPDKRPEMAERYEVTEYGTIVVEADDDDSTRVSETTEEALTNALIRITEARDKRLYYVTGHGEPDLEARDVPQGYGLLASSLENEGYEVEEILLGAVPDVPADADVLLVAGPQRPFLDRELEVLDRYLDRGGKAIFLVDPQSGESLRPLLSERGIRLGDDIIVDQFVQLFGGAQLGIEPIASDYGDHPITRNFGQRTIYTMVRSVAPAENLPEGVEAATLVRTSQNSWAESDVGRLMEASEAGLDEEDREGPISIAAAATLTGPALDWSEPRIATLAEAGGAEGDEAATGEGEETTTGEGDGDATAEQTAAGDTESGPPADLEGKIAVFGDSEWVNNRAISLYFNEDLFLNTLGWMSGEEELISIRPRTMRASRVVLTAGESRTIFYVTVLLLPEIILFAGLAIWWTRRR